MTRKPRYFDTVGIIHDEAFAHDEDPLAFPLTPPNSGLCPNEEATKFLDWSRDTKDLPLDYRVSKSIGTGVTAIAAGKFRRPVHTLIDPANLEYVEAYVNTVPGRYGIKALRFQGTRIMGTVLLGDWREERARPIAQQKMQIRGAFVSRLPKTTDRHELCRS